MKSTVLITIVNGKITSALANGDAEIHIELADGIHNISTKVITNSEMDTHLGRVKPMARHHHNAFPKGRW